MILLLFIFCELIKLKLKRLYNFFVNIIGMKRHKMLSLPWVCLNLHLLSTLKQLNNMKAMITDLIFVRFKAEFHFFIPDFTVVIPFFYIVYSILLIADFRFFVVLVKSGLWSRGEGWDPINRFNPTTFLCLPQASTWISNGMS